MDNKTKKRITKKEPTLSWLLLFLLQCTVSNYCLYKLSLAIPYIRVRAFFIYVTSGRGESGGCVKSRSDFCGRLVESPARRSQRLRQRSRRTQSFSLAAIKLGLQFSLPDSVYKLHKTVSVILYKSVKYTKFDSE